MGNELSTNNVAEKRPGPARMTKEQRDHLPNTRHKQYQLSRISGEESGSACSEDMLLGARRDTQLNGDYRPGSEGSLGSEDYLLGDNIRDDLCRSKSNVIDGHQYLSRVENWDYRSSDESEECVQSMNVLKHFLRERENADGASIATGDLWEKRWRDVIRRLNKAEEERAEIRKLLYAMNLKISRVTTVKSHKSKSDKAIARSVYHDTASSDSELSSSEFDAKSHARVAGKQHNKDHQNFTKSSAVDLLSNDETPHKNAKHSGKKRGKKKVKKVQNQQSELDAINYKGSDSEMIPRNRVYHRYQTSVQC